MKLEKGKFYRTRSGEKVECLTTERKEKNRECVMMDKMGILFYSNHNDTDIISEWSDVEIPWEDYPRWCNWVAYDGKSDKWFGYSEEPYQYKNYSEWLNDKGVHFSIPSEYAPKGFEGDWKESKFERPNTKEI